MGTFLLWFQGDTFNVVQQETSEGCLNSSSCLGDDVV